MTAKRFTIVNMGLDGQYIKENGKIMEIGRVVDLLNENEELKKGLRDDVNEIESIICENQKLKNLIKTVLETTPIEHNLALELKESVRELYD